MGPFFLQLEWSWGAGSYCLIDKRPEDRTWGLCWVWLVIFFCWRQEARSDQTVLRPRSEKDVEPGPSQPSWETQACCSLPASLPGDVRGRSLGGVSGGRVWIRFKFRES